MLHNKMISESKTLNIKMKPHHQNSLTFLTNDLLKAEWKFSCFFFLSHKSFIGNATKNAAEWELLFFSRFHRHLNKWYLTAEIYAAFAL